MSIRGRISKGLPTLAALALLAAGPALWAGEAKAEGDGGPLKVLMVGNSFSVCARAYLPPLAKAQGRKLLLEHATIGGCTLARHVKEWDASEADPEHKPYGSGKGKANLREALTREPWDIVTIQQASHDSWRPESYEPHAGRLIGIIRELAPTAEIVVQQTWVYRPDDGRLGNWKIDQDQMHAGLAACYRDLAARYGLRVIPMGEAVRISRENEPARFAPTDRAQFKNYRWPDLPPQAGDVVGKASWGKNRDTGKLRINLDPSHLNKRGEYLQALVWYGVLFPDGRDEAVAFIPGEIDVDDAAFLAQCAKEALALLDPESGNLPPPADAKAAD